MSRPRAEEWSVIGEESDPVPGDPHEVARLGRDLRKTAKAILKQADEIKALSTVEAWKSKAAEEFRSEADEAEGKLRKAFKRYDAAADALGEKVAEGACSTEYASELQRAQTMADKALKDAQEADGEHKASAMAIDKLPKQADSDDSGRKRLERRQEAASSAMARARKELEAAKAVRDGAVKRAREAIRYAIDHDGLKDGTWDKFKDWVHDNSKFLEKWLNRVGWIATICGTLSLLVGWIPIVGQALAGILGTIALIATVISLVGHVAMALAGEGSWFDVALDVVGLATLGIGRGAIAGAKGAAAGAKVLARRSVGGAMRATIKAKPGTRAYNKAVQESFKTANRLSGGALRGKAGAEALAKAPKGWFPGAGRLGEAFSPAAIAKEGWDGLKGVKELRNFPLRAEQWRGAQFKFGDSGLDGLVREIDAIAPGAREAGDVKDMLNVFQTQTRIWQGSTMVASISDLGDKGDLWRHVGLDDGLWGATGVKDATTTSDG